MFSIFKHKHKQKEHKTKVGQDRIAASIAVRIIRFQQQWAMWMQRRSERFSATAKKIGLTVFCLLSGFYSIYLITGTFTSKQGSSLSIASIQLPDYFSKPPHYRKWNYPLPTTDEYLKIKQFTSYIDSLSKNQQGKKVADSILGSRPSLMDSIALIEKLYQLQSSKK